jgi:pimeloyl-ACP methyl ester carboxylesterase
MHRFFRGDFFNFEVIRILGLARYDGADLAECLEAISQIRENDSGSWHKAWAEQAERAERVAEEALRQGQARAARAAFLRASNYTRASVYMMTGSRLGESDLRVASGLRKSRELFRRATPLFDGAVHELQIPFQAQAVDNGGGGKVFSLPGYLYLPPQSRRLQVPGGKTPVLINLIGGDSTQEEIYYMFPAAGPELGYAVLTFEGPGQGLTLHEHGIPLRPDWEVVGRAVLDHLFQYAAEHPDFGLDLTRVAVAGASLGGYLALRMAADPRCSACVAIDPVYDLYDFATKHTGAASFFSLWHAGWIPDWLVDGIILAGTRAAFQSRWEIFTSARFLGVKRPVELLRAMKGFTLREPRRKTQESKSAESESESDDVGSYVGRLRCPVLVSGASASLYFNVEEHTGKVFAALQSPGKELWVAKIPSEGGLQAKMGAVGICNQYVFAYLDKQFSIQRKEL